MPSPAAAPTHPVPAAPTAARCKAAKKYQPESVRLLIVAEAPPCTPERYYYFEHVDQHDWLFRYVWEGLTGQKPDRARKAECLAALQAAGVFMIDLHEDQISEPSAKDLAPCVPGLIARCKELRPKAIVLIKSVVYDVAFEALTQAGLPVVDERIPFPASGQQKKFLEGFDAAAGGLVKVRPLA